MYSINKQHHRKMLPDSSEKEGEAGARSKIFSHPVIGKTTYNKITVHRNAQKYN